MTAQTLFFACCTLLVLLGPCGSAAAAAAAGHHLTLDFDLAGHRLLGTSRLHLEAGTGLRLDCGPLTVTGVSVAPEGDTPPNLAGGASIVLAAAPEARTLTVTWELQTPAEGAADNRIAADGITLAGFWHPKADRDLAFRLETTLPGNFLALAGGRPLSATPAGDLQRLAVELAAAGPHLPFVAGPYTVQSRRVGPTLIETWFFAEDAGLAAGYLDSAAAALERFTRLIGPFPVERWAMVENRLPTGYAYPGFTLLGQAVVRLPFIRDTALVHEVAHAWFGTAVQVDPAGGDWAEGLTAYLADHGTAEASGTGPAHRKGLLTRIEAYAHGEQAIPLTAFRGAPNLDSKNRALRAVGYDKGALLFHMLCRRIGERAFVDGLQRLYTEYRDRRAGWPEVTAAFAAEAGKDLRPFFAQWLERTDLPVLAIDKAHLDQREGVTRLRFELVQQTTPPFDLSVPVRVQTLLGATTRQVHTDSVRREVTLEVSGLPTRLTLDADFDLLRRLDPAERPPTWAEFLGGAERSVLLPAAAGRAVFAPLIDTLRAAGCRLVEAETVTGRALASGSWLFLGDSSRRRSLFAAPPAKVDGFSLEVRRSPLDPEAVLVLVDSASADETGQAAPRLEHYGGFSRLHFLAGRNLEKTLAPAADGISLELLAPPAGMPTAAMLDFDRIVDDLAESRVIHLGETHTSYGDHLVQLQILQALHGRGHKLAIGLEMFSRSRQQALDDYIAGRTDERTFLKQSAYHHEWGYDYRLYREILQFARAVRIPLVALNLDPGVSGRVFSDGHTDGLAATERADLPAERDLDLPGYRERIAAAHAAHPAGSGSFSGFLQAQGLWDETMAESVVRALERFPSYTVVVLAGNGHSHKTSGIPPRVARRVPGVEQRVVQVAGAEVTAGEADYLLFAPAIDLEPAPKLGVILTPTGQADGAKGLIVQGFSPHGQAETAGLRRGDRILAVNGMTVREVTDIRIALLDRKAGDTVEIRLRRGEREQSLTMPLTPLPEGSSLPPGHPELKK